MNLQVSLLVLLCGGELLGLLAFGDDAAKDGEPKNRKRCVVRNARFFGRKWCGRRGTEVGRAVRRNQPTAIRLQAQRRAS